MIITENLVKLYMAGETEVRAVNDVSIEIPKGEFMAIIGPSGSGKSTLLNLLGCLDTPTSGRVLIDGAETSRLSSKELTRIRREKIGFVFQEFNLLPVMTAAENVELPLRYLGFGGKDRFRMALEALDKVGLSHRAKSRPTQLSGGEKQRVAIARALVTKPALVLADEPTGELDTYNTCKVIEIMRMLNSELEQTFAIVTHDPMVAEYAGRVVSLRDGRVNTDAAQQPAELTCEMDRTV